MVHFGRSAIKREWDPHQSKGQSAAEARAARVCPMPARENAHDAAGRSIEHF
jgi:hypothetical protein